MPPRTKCVYREGSIRCPKDGTGNPPLCEPHRVMLETDQSFSGLGERIGKVLGKVVRGERVRPKEAREAVVEGLGFMAAVATAYVYDQQGVARPGPGQRPSREPFVDWAYQRLKQREREQTARDGAGTGARDPGELYRLRREARRILGWAPDQVVTLDEVNKRRRELARKFHPDRSGGSVEKMQTINAAADVLVAELGG